MTDSKVFSLFNQSGKIEEIKPKGNLPMYCKVYCYGVGMSEYEAAVISEPNEYGAQKCVFISDYKHGFTTIDKYSRPHSKKFGIGHYYSDTFETWPEEVVKDAIAKAIEADKVREEEARKQKEADEKEIKELPSKYPHLTKVKDHAKGYFAACKDNIRADLKKNFPSFKFSVKSDHYDSIDITWTNGPTVKEVQAVTDKYEDHETDFTGDYRDPNQSNFNKMFGGANFIHENRNSTPEIDALVNTLNETHQGVDKWENSQIIHRIFSKTSLPAKFENVRLERTEKTAGFIDDFYRISFFTPVSEAKVSVRAESVQIVDYSEKAIAVIGDTKPIKDKLKELGGKFNFRLTCGAGWIFPKTKENVVREALK